MSSMMLCPPTVASPDEGGYMPVNMLIVVVLPEGEVMFQQFRGQYTSHRVMKCIGVFLWKIFQFLIYQFIQAINSLIDFTSFQ